VRNPASYGYSNAVAFLAGYAGWDRGLTPEELQQSAVTLQTQFNATCRLTVPAETAQGCVINNPVASDYVTNSRVSLKALPKDGFVFSGWTGDVPAGLETANPLVFTMNADKLIQARFTRPPVVVSLDQTPAGEAAIQFLALSNVAYTVEYRDDLGPASWQKLADVAPQISTGFVTNSDPGMQSRLQRFYRVVTQGP
jgi:hypothetical protein